MFNFFQPFETEVWLTFLIAYLVTAVALWIVARVTPYEKRNPKAPPVYTLTSSLWFIFSSVFRGSNITPQVRSGVTLSAVTRRTFWLPRPACTASFSTFIGNIYKGFPF